MSNLQILVCSSLFFMANVCCSIETEPRTLRQGQLILAREVAADVVQKMEPKEASTIFIKGLVTVKDIDPVEENGHEDHEEHVDCCNKEKDEVLDSPCQCKIITSNIESPDQMNLTDKEPLSAPF